MKLIRFAVFAALAACASLACADANQICATAYETARQDKIVVTTSQTGRIVSGHGRLFFHSAPDDHCRLKDVFVIPHDRLEVFADHGGYTEVIYWNPVTGSGTAGWVPSARLAEIREMVGLAAAHDDKY
jgi:hypothetical protein